MTGTAVSFAGASGTGLALREDLAKSLANASMSMPAIGGDKPYLKMDKNNGDWLYGQEETLVEAGSLWAVNPTSLKHGYVAWDSDAGGAPVQEVMVPISRLLPPLDSLPGLPIGKKGKQLEYQAQRSVDLVCVTGEDAGTAVEYKQSSTGAMKLFGTLTNSLLAQLAKDPDNIVAIVELTFDKYKHSKYGWIHNPIFKLVEWRAIDDTSTPDAPVAEAAPAPRTRAAAAPTTAAPKTIEAEPAAESDEDKALAAEYAAAAGAAAGAEATPRRRVRR